MNNQKINQLIIIGGGASIKEGIAKGLWQKIEDKYTMGLNYSYKFFPNPTLQSYVDRDFYENNIKDLEKLPLIVGQSFPIKYASNTLTLSVTDKYKRDIKLHGCYKASLAGIFALSLGIYLLDEGEIFLLGYDYGELRKKDPTKFITNKQEAQEIIYKDSDNKALTHFYQGELKHRGIGIISYYNLRNRADRDFDCYKEEKSVKIYNVSKKSKIKTFPTLTYEEFFQKLNKEKYNQEELRNRIKQKLGG